VRPIWIARPRSALLALISEQVARGDSGSPPTSWWQNWKSVRSCSGSLRPRHLQEKWFPKARAGSEIPVGALSDGTARRIRPLVAPTNVPEAAMHTKAVLDGDHWVIKRAQAVHLQWATNASLYVVYANTDPSVGMLQGDVQLPGPPGYAGLHGHQMQRTMGCAS